jgi:hypothetical protein
MAGTAKTTPKVRASKLIAIFFIVFPPAKKFRNLAWFVQPDIPLNTGITLPRYVVVTSFPGCFSLTAQYYGTFSV